MSCDLMSSALCSVVWCDLVVVRDGVLKEGSVYVLHVHNTTYSISCDVMSSLLCSLVWVSCLAMHLPT